MFSFTLYITTDCNFKCQYCYEDYHNHYQLNEKTLVDSLEFMMNYGDRGKVLIDFLGGEPLLKKDLIYQAASYIQSNYPEREVKYYITTNCSLMDDQFIAFMKENHFTVRLSFDGNKETHDLNRVAKDGVSCYDKIFENIMKIKDSGLNFSVRMTVTENTIPHMFENIYYLHEHGLDNIGMIMDVYLKISDDLKIEFEKQVGQILQYYLDEAASGRIFNIDQFDGKMFNMLCDFGNCFGMCDAGIGNFKIFPNGQIYPCGFLTSNEKYCIGNIKEGVDIRKAKLIAISNFDKTDPKCKGSNIILLVSVPFISRILGKLIQETSSQVLEGYNSITSVLTNTYDNWFITRLFQCGQYVHDRYFENNQKYKKETNRQNLLYILNTSTILVIQFIGTVIIWVVGAQEVFKENMTIGTIMALMNYQTIIMNPKVKKYYNFM